MTESGLPKGNTAVLPCPREPPGVKQQLRGLCCTSRPLSVFELFSIAKNQENHLAYRSVPLPLSSARRVFVFLLFRFGPFLFFFSSDMEAYVVSYRDTREKGGKVAYNLLLLGLGVTLPYMEAGLSMKLGELVIVRVSWLRA